MIGKKKLLLLLCTLSLGLVGCGGATDKKGDAKEGFKIGICQLTQHAALDEANRGFNEKIKELSKEAGLEVNIDFQNAQGDFQTAQTINKQFVSDKKDLIFAIATPAAQAAYNSTKEIPIVCTAVTDPVAAEIAKSFEKSETNVTGVSDMVPVDKQIELLKKLLPEAKTIGFVYNTSEANSKAQLDLVIKEGEKLGLKVKEIGVTNVNEIEQNLRAGLKGVDVLYAPTDNVVASAYGLVAKVCLQNKIPVFCAEEAAVNKGGLITMGISYNELGEKAAIKAFEILKDKKNPAEMEIEVSDNLGITINEDVFKALGIAIPEDIKKDAKIIKGGLE